MNFNRDEKQTNVKMSISQELIGYWRVGDRRYEFRDDGRYYIHDIGVPYQLINSGMTLIQNNRTQYNRLYGDPNGLAGVWLLDEDQIEEWNLRSDGSYTYHWPGFEYFGEYSFDETTMNTNEMRAEISELSAGVLRYDPPYATSMDVTWSIVEPNLTINFPTGDVVYIRE